MAEAPLPIISLDERNEAEILAEAIQRVYDASGRKLNDFSAGSPLSALLEGQVFASAELLAYANRLPAAFTLEFLARIFRIKRSLGQKSRATVVITLSGPAPQPLVIPSGTVIRTANGIGFQTVSQLVFGPNEVEKSVIVESQTSGAKNNVGPNTITQFAVKPARVASVTNPEAATGGTNEESLEDVLGRGFSFVNERLPVGIQDWVNYVEGYLGIGAPVIIRNRRSGPVRRNSDQMFGSGLVSIWVLDQNGQPLSEASLEGLRAYLNASKPLHYDLRVFNCAVQEADLDITLSWNPATQNPSMDAELLNETLRIELRPHSGGPNFAGEDLSLEAIRRVIYDAVPEYEIVDIKGQGLRVENDFTAIKLGRITIRFLSKSNSLVMTFLN